MAFSVNTNTGAMAALQSLSATNKSMDVTQSRITTGLSVSSTKDDSAKFTVAQTLRGDMGGLNAVTSSLNNAKSVVDVAVSGVEQISDLVNDMKSKAYEVASETDQGSRDAIIKDYDNLKKQIDSIISSSDFNGVNLLDASGGEVKSLQSLDVSVGSTLDVASIDLETELTTAGTGGGALDGATDLVDAATAGTAVTALDTLSDSLNDHLSTLGAASRQIEGQLEFNSSLTDVIETGIGNLVDADLAKESAKLQALQVQQQLGVQALSIANQAPQTILSLFR
ncbi:flagellin [Novosphingobium sp. YJ-S2-02]|uniref:Flagellin n=1 Tax=Novosphingobium aureum TaxID=2792964 RepID=A0A931H9L2_9SPHN|nr:flagellin [Novosphingobium aureum]MBH0111897.1 flagellin [Novosphingobium aureum]